MLSDYLKTFPQFVLPKRALTAFAGCLANVKNPAVKNQLIRHFIRRFAVDMTEAREERPEQYACFNDFFIRQLKPECRPLASADILSPVDGFISELGEINAGKLLQAKGWYYSVQELLAGDEQKSKQFAHGRFATLYLSPKDYHRVHMPIDAVLKEMIYVPGKLFSVQPATARVIPRLFARNERLVVYFETKIGPMAMVLVGATIVGGIGTSWHGDIMRGRKPAQYVYPEEGENAYALSQAQEMGYFKLGSTVILMFAEGQSMQWLEQLHAGKQIRFGEAFGRIK
ncbi:MULTISPECIES: archaetidylserine decarboxylase [Legionella]|uniref:Phosphatidylserine decarboxylase proenzyme n=1 Tax=Legionella septentrionalis TaxID=2498109 RepID=A0A433JJS2_9GAMM|nr:MULTISPECIES: archaetidylserine decarboxylase [Legionella]MCP0914954.1 archaetidylserine decarboxylase [Legionella sp. 27cVA30]RUQ88651.1 phosphatidylserine decarboxylase [Legionella septentrionalis]RUQ97047.1 phosphatidylserine decarboxylase [Legionella septentrionalis]RUR09541.1 phosphatidylserine decarboxylase [Legionella septentrionalis]RUR16342.1 phosphatidylserine decarboxylase [Legionella septentrionalis]